MLIRQVIEKLVLSVLEIAFFFKHMAQTARVFIRKDGRHFTEIFF